jgi:hypothetical protein
MAETQRGLTEGEKSILKELKSISNYEKLISEHLLSLERVLWQLLSQLGKAEEGFGRFDSPGRMENHALLKRTPKH